VEEGEYFYVPKKKIETVKVLLQRGREVIADLVDELTFHDGLKESEIMVPIDMRGAGNEAFDDVETMVQKVGLQGAAEAFVKAWEFFETNKETLPLTKRPTNITAEEWKAILEDDLQEGDADLEDVWENLGRLAEATALVDVQPRSFRDCMTASVMM